MGYTFVVHLPPVLFLHAHQITNAPSWTIIEDGRYYSQAVRERVKVSPLLE